jgi:DNA-binding transcriptional ArsR family regulator
MLMFKEKDMDDITKLGFLFQTLADANRLKIIGFIGNKTCSVSEIVEATGLSQPLVSHHLKILRDKNVLITERQGPFVYHKLKDIRMLDALGVFSEIAESMAKTEYGDRAFSCPPWFKQSFAMKRRKVWDIKKK